MKFTGKVKANGHTVMIIADKPIQLKEDTCIVEITEKDSRTLQQNKLLWKLIGEICFYEDGDLSHKEDMYLTLLQMSGAKYDFYTMPEAAYKQFKQKWRDCKIVKKDMVNNIPYITVQAIYGSSTYNKKEMGALIDTTLKYANEVGINTTYWEELLHA